MINGQNDPLRSWGFTIDQDNGSKVFKNVQEVYPIHLSINTTFQNYRSHKSKPVLKSTN